MKTTSLTLLALTIIFPAASFAEEEVIRDPDISMDIASLTLDREFSEQLSNSAPKVARPQPPDYPRKLRRKKVEGVVIVEVVIGTDGTVTATEVIESPDERLSELAVAAAREWMFIPALKAGRPVEARVRLPFTFAARGLDKD